MTIPDLHEPLSDLRSVYLLGLPEKISAIEEMWSFLRKRWDEAQVSELIMLVQDLAGGADAFHLREIAEASRYTEELLSESLKYGIPAQYVLHEITTNIRTLGSFAHEVQRSGTNRSASGGEIYLVDPDQDGAQAISKAFKSAGLEVRHFSRLREMTRSLTYDRPALLIVSDAVTDGKASEVAREYPQVRFQQIPVVLIAGSDDFESRLDALREGVRHWVTRPVLPHQLVKSVQGILAPVSQQTNVLFISSRHVLTDFVCQAIRDAGANLHVEQDASRIRDTLAAFIPDICLVDQDLGTCTGEELVMLLRQDTEMLGVPVYILTPDANGYSQLDALRAGADGILDRDGSSELFRQVFQRTVHREGSGPVKHPAQDEKPEPDEKFQREMQALAGQKEELATKVQELEERLQEAYEEAAKSQAIAMENLVANREQVEDLEKHRQDLEEKIQDLEKRLSGREPSPPASPELLEPGHVLLTSGNNRYEIINKIARGGMSNTYLADSKNDGQRVVIKMLFQDALSQTNALMRFMNEARTLLDLDHPNLVKGLDFQQDRNSCYLVMEYVEGMSLRQMIDEYGAMDPLWSTQVVHVIAHILEYLESLQLVHRDIKPENIIINGKGEVKLVDFGLAIQQEQDFSLTRDGLILGTPLYLSPEQIYGDDADIRSDIYSLGATYYHLVTGAPPFPGKTFLEILQKRSMGLPDPQAKNPNLPLPVSITLKRMLALKKQWRPENAEALIEELDNVLAHLSTES